MRDHLTQSDCDRSRRKDSISYCRMCLFTMKSSVATNRASTTGPDDVVDLDPSNQPKPPSRQKYVPPTGSIFAFILAFRIVNALSIRTFFQPDEYFQSLEPAWQMVFGESSGAWITWEWRNSLRSSIHPSAYAAIFYICSGVADVCHLSPATRANLLIAMPKVLQAFCAALGDWYTWRLSQKVHGDDRSIAWVTLAITIGSPWQWFCSTRTLSNCLETSLTVAALSLWPWNWLPTTKSQERNTERPLYGVDLTSLRQCLILAALACVLRPTNILIWICLSSFLFYYSSIEKGLLFLREVLLWGLLVLTMSLFLDRVYYGYWTFPPWRFVNFNITQSLAVFYGKNDWHYYISQGVPLLLTTALPFGLVGFTKAWGNKSAPPSNNLDIPSASVKLQLAITTTFVIFALSMISHKEVRFIYPLLPILHLFCAEGFLYIFPAFLSERKRLQHPRIFRRSSVLVLSVFILNASIALYTTLYHQSGVISVIDHLRHDSELSTRVTPMSVAFMMPCHSTPWRSHLVHPSIVATALSCEPPIGLSILERIGYLDEADIFYQDPVGFVKTRFGREEHPWPDKFIFFEQLQGAMEEAVDQSLGYVECWRVFNSHWHDDWRRKGDVIEWCRDSTRARQ